MSRPPGSVGKHRHRAEVIFARHGKDPLEELLKLADDPSLTVERRIGIWLQLMQFVYPRLRSVTIEGGRLTFDDLLAQPAEVQDEFMRCAAAWAEEQRVREKEWAAEWKKDEIRKAKNLPLPTCRADLARYE